MKNAKTIQGQWFIFGDNQPPAVGVLRYDPDSGLTLDVQRHRAPNLAQAFAGFFNVPTVVRGVDAHGTPVSLFGCVTFNSNSTAALDSYKIGVACALFGARFSQFSDAAFAEVRASYSILDAWLTRSSLVRVPQETGLLAFSQQPQTDITVPLPDGTVITLTMSLGQQTNFSSITLSQSQFVLFRTTGPTPMRNLIDDYVFKFGKLLSFLARTDVFVDEIVIPQNERMPRAVEWLSSLPGSTKAKRTLHPHEGLVSYQEVAAQLPALVVRWYQYYDEMEAILNLYFTAVSKSDIPANTRFLLLAQALEAYHARSARFVAEIQPTAVFRARRDALIAGVPSAERTWLREKLSFANQKTLAMRLTELIADQQTYVAQFIIDTTLFANTIRWTRNYYTHYGEDEEERIAAGNARIAQGADIINYSIQMQALLELLFIRDLNLPTAAVNRAIQGAAQRRVISVN